MENKTQFSGKDIWTSTDLFFMLISEVTSFLSIAGCLFIIALYVVFKELRTTSRMLLVFLSVADCIVGLSTFAQTKMYASPREMPSQSSIVCQGSAGLYVMSQVCVALWTSAVAGYLFMCVTLRWVAIANRLVFLFHAFCWGMPIVVAMSADVSGIYGYNAADILMQRHPTSCWVSDRVGNPLPWYLITVEGWVMGTFSLICLLYVPITWSIVRGKGKGKEITDEDVIEELAKQTANEQLRFIPVIYVCTRIWGCAHFLFTRYPEHPNLRASDWLLMFRAFGDNSQGLINAIFFCLATKQIRTLLSSRLPCCWLCMAGCCLRTRTLGKRTWLRVPIVRMQRRRPSKTRALDGSDLDISGISLDLPPPDSVRIEEEDHDVIFER